MNKISIGVVGGSYDASESTDCLINSLSPELLEKIFEEYILDDDVEKELTLKASTRHPFQVAPFDVCHLWREILLSRSRFWTSITVDYGHFAKLDLDGHSDGRDVVELCELLRERLETVGGRPISFTIFDSSQWWIGQRYRNALYCLLSLLEVLKLKQPYFKHYHESLETGNTFYFLYRSLSTEKFSHLKSLKIVDHPNRLFPRATSFSELDGMCKVNFPSLQVLELHVYGDTNKVLSRFSGESVHTLICVTWVPHPLTVDFFRSLQSFPALRHFDTGGLVPSFATDEEKSQIRSHAKVEHITGWGTRLMAFIDIAFPNVTSLTLLREENIVLPILPPGEEYLSKLIRLSLVHCTLHKGGDGMGEEEFPNHSETDETDAWEKMVPYLSNLRDLRISACRRNRMDELPYQGAALERQPITPWSEGVAVCPLLSEAISSSLLRTNVRTHDGRQTNMYFPRLEHFRISGTITETCSLQLLDAMKMRNLGSVASCRITFWNTYVEASGPEKCKFYRVANVEDATYDEMLERQEILELQRVLNGH